MLLNEVKKYGYPYAQHEGIRGSRGTTPFILKLGTT
jgi:hypothetical protein